MTTTDAVPLRTLDPAHVSRVVRALLIEADRDILIEDGPRRDLVSIPFDAAAAEDGLLPVILVAAEALETNGQSYARAIEIALNEGRISEETAEDVRREIG